jgi:hypothetical protein
VDAMSVGIYDDVDDGVAWREEEKLKPALLPSPI